MFFVIAGVQPRTRTLNHSPRRCPRCGLHQAYIQQADHYFSLFFIPLIRVKRGVPYLFCRRCDQVVDGNGADGDRFGEGHDPGTGHDCRRCGRSLGTGFLYCPYCGQRQ